MAGKSSQNAPKLVIVESPSKARTIHKILGNEFDVKACMGHVRDLPKGKFGIDIEAGFVPTYRVIPSRKKVVQELRESSKKASSVYLAPDPDREGEAIAWHLMQALELSNQRTHRVTFNEITTQAVQEAFRHPRTINLDLVNAQQARRFLDRIVGYRLSPLLWKKVARGLSAGRVQSVTVKLLVEREGEIQAFKPEEYWKLTATLEAAPAAKSFPAELVRLGEKEARVPNREEAEALVQELRRGPFVVQEVHTKERTEKPPPPFSTSLLQQQASIRLGFTTRRTMRVAQQLYEGVDLGEEGPVGLITYMRTDSFRVAEQALTECRSYVEQTFGKKLLADQPQVYASRKGAQEAHEAIRPSSVIRTPESVKKFLTAEQMKLYELIWKRFVATQMKPARYLLTEADIRSGRGIFLAKGRQVLFEGFTRIAGHLKRGEDVILPSLEKGQTLRLLKLEPSQHFTEPPPRYTEATLVRTLEKHGIGRPSTYAPIISTIQDRGYVRREARKLYATELGILVTELLQQHFTAIMDTQFTSQLEEKLDQIEDAGADWRIVLSEFHKVFDADLERAKLEMENVKAQAPESKEPCEKCGSPMVVRWTRLGKFLGCSNYPTCRHSRSAEVYEIEGDTQCPSCGGTTGIRLGRRGAFLACGRYPDCKGTLTVLPAGEKRYRVLRESCPNCQAPMRLLFGRRGRFLACTKYPECKTTRPMPRPAPEAAAQKQEPSEDEEQDDQQTEERPETSTPA